MSEENEKTEAEIEKYNLTAIPLKKVRLLNFVFLTPTLSGFEITNVETLAIQNSLVLRAANIYHHLNFTEER